MLNIITLLLIAIVCTIAKVRYEIRKRKMFIKNSKVINILSNSNAIRWRKK